MENHTVVQLNAIAKVRDIRGYFKLIKKEFIRVLKATYLISRFRTIPPQFYNHNLGGHQISRRKLIKI